MCTRVKCSKCGKASFAGCGRHVEQVLAGVPASERCRCREERGGGGTAKPRQRRSWWPF